MQTTQIALFPLQMIVLPGETSKLHIFEERYKQLLEDCRIPGALFGIPYAVNGFLSGSGSLVELSQIIKRYHNGSADIEVKGIDVFKLKHFQIRLGEKPYPGGAVVRMHSEKSPPVSGDLLHRLDIYVREAAPERFLEVLSASLNAYDVGRILKIEDDQKLKLIKAVDDVARERVLANNLSMLHALHMQRKSVVGDVFLN